jgi:GNAT superfamily N-acetyltransferase
MDLIEHDTVTECSCDLLSWDTGFFGFNIGRLTAAELTESCASEVVRWCDDHEIRCLYYLAEPGSRLTVQAAERFSFKNVDRRVLYGADIRTLLELGAGNAVVRPAVKSDVEPLQMIARVSHYDSRFFQDGGFDRKRCEDLYAQWIANSLEGWADAVFVATHAQHPVGYITCSHDGAGRGTIDLIGVADSVRGRGFGTALISRAARWYSDAGASTVDVVTQHRNSQARSFYERLGFSKRDEKIWFHKWFERSDR